MWLAYCALVFVLFDTIVELHAMDDKTLNGFLIEKWKCILRELKAHLIHELYVVYVVEAFIILNWNA